MLNRKMVKLIVVLALLFALATVIVFAAKIKSDVSIKIPDKFGAAANDYYKGLNSNYGSGFGFQIAGIILIALSLGVSAFEHKSIM